MTTPEDGAAVMAALADRRSAVAVKPDPVPRDLVERIIEAATWAPNHFRTEPWRFAVVQGSARSALGDVLAASASNREDAMHLDEEARAHMETLVAKERRKPLRAPVVIAVAAVPSDRPRVEPLEDICAVAAGIENMLLAANALGLGAMWRTGEPARDPAVRAFLRFPDTAQILAFLYVGYPELYSQHHRTPNAPQHTRWLPED